jgi:hypothetical protein
MKQLYIILCLLAYTKLVLAEKPPTVITFYNLENLFDTINDPKINDEDFLPNGAYAYTTAVYQKKLNNLSDVLSKLGTDKNIDGFAVCGVAEIENENVLQDLVKQPKLINRNLKIVHFNSPDARGIDVGLLYNPKYFKLLGAQALPVNLPDDGSGSGKERTRDVLWVTGKLNGELTHFFVNHWPSRRGGEAASAPKRNFAAAVGKKIMDSLTSENADVKFITMGDLNDDPNNESIAKIYNAKAKTKDVTKGAMYNPFLDFYNDGVGTHAYQDAWGLFDQIILSRGFINKKAEGARFEKAEVFNRSFLTEKFGQYRGYPKRAFSGNLWNDGYSDHYPTIVYLN